MPTFVAGGLLAVVLAAGAAEKPASEAEHLRRLIEQLASDQFRQREDALAALEALGPSALPALHQALQNSELDVRRHAAELVERLERQAESAQVLKAKTLRLVCKDLPVPAAVAELARLSGGGIHLIGDQAEMSRRRVTLDTGETTFWAALAQLCRVAGLRERPSKPPAGDRDGVSVTGSLARGNRKIRYLDIDAWVQSPTEAGSLELEEGLEPVLPTTTVGSLRIRALSAAHGICAGGHDWALLHLEMKPAPHLDWQRVLQVRVTRAIDEHGQVLRPGSAFVDGSHLKALDDDEAVVIWDGPVEVPSNAGYRQVPLLLHRGPRPAGRIRELHGTIAAQVRPPVETVVRVENVLCGKGQTFRGKDGTVLKITGIVNDDDGACRIDVQVTASPEEPGMALAAGKMVRLLREDNRALVESEKAMFTLQDEHGRPIRVVNGVSSFHPEGRLKLYTLHFQASKENGNPARLLYHARPTVLIEVPFILRDIPVAEK
jgi:hypothetical protein